MTSRTRSVTTLLIGVFFTLGTPTTWAQGLDVTIRRPARITVGDPVDLEVRAHLASGATLIDGLLHPAGPLPEGVRILDVSPLARSDDATLTGRMRIAFFRPGQQNLPILALAYRSAGGATVDTLLSQPTPIDVAAVLPPGAQAPKDIRDIEALGDGSTWRLLIVALVVGGAAAALAYPAYRWLRRRRRAAGLMAAVPPRPPVSKSAYERALERLEEVAAARWPQRGAVDRHYDLVTDVLRRYLEEAEAVKALERTTGELVRSLPPSLGNGDGRDLCQRVLGEADLVKFARYRPGEQQAANFLLKGRALLKRWHETSSHAIG